MSGGLRPTPTLRPIGDRCLMVEFGDTVSLEVNARACDFALHVRALNWRFITDVVPTFCGVGLHYRPEAVPLHAEKSPHAAMVSLVGAALAQPGQGASTSPRIVTIPVCYGGEWGPDLDELGQRAGLTPDELVRQHTEEPRRVFMVGFAPGHPYIGLWGEAFDAPRRSTPRTRVPAGSVAIANRQCVIYPGELPGGWNVIGRTPRRLFDPAAAEPCLLAPGDLVRFVAVSAADFAAMQPARYA